MTRPFTLWVMDKCTHPPLALLWANGAIMQGGDLIQVVNERPELLAQLANNGAEYVLALEVG